LPSSAGAAASGVADWTEIPTHNPFSFDRNDIAILAPAEPPKPTLTAGPKPILFGTFNLGTGWSAMLASGQPNNRNSRPMKVGEGLDGWTIVQIQDKSIVIEANSQRETLIMDPVGQVQRDYSKTLAAVAASAPVQTNSPQSAVQSQGTPAPASTTSYAPPGAKKTKQVYTPFGYVTVEDK
jgi:hypothetical protein